MGRGDLRHLRTVETGAGWFRFTPDSARVWCGRINYGPRQPHAVTCWDASSGEKKIEFPLVGEGEFAVYAHGSRRQHGLSLAS